MLLERFTDEFLEPLPKHEVVWVVHRGLQLEQLLLCDLSQADLLLVDVSIEVVLNLLHGHMLQ